MKQTRLSSLFLLCITLSILLLPNHYEAVGYDSNPQIGFYGTYEEPENPQKPNQNIPIQPHNKGNNQVIIPRLGDVSHTNNIICSVLFISAALLLKRRKVISK